MARQDLVLVRMACLARVTDDSGYIQLRHPTPEQLGCFGLLGLAVVAS